MSTKRKLKLSKIPLKNKPKYADQSELSRRVIEIMKRIDFQGRDKTIFQLRGRSSHLLVYNEVTDTANGDMMALSHARKLKNEMSDWEIAREIYILMCQLAVHEAAENFRLDGNIMFNPHLADRNAILFKAVEMSAHESPATAVSAIYGGFAAAIEASNPPPPPSKKWWEWWELWWWGVVCLLIIAAVMYFFK